MRWQKRVLHRTGRFVLAKPHQKHHLSKILLTQSVQIWPVGAVALLPSVAGFVKLSGPLPGDGAQSHRDRRSPARAKMR